MYWINTIKLKITAQKQGNFTKLKKNLSACHLSTIIHVLTQLALLLD